MVVLSLQGQQILKTYRLVYRLALVSTRLHFLCSFTGNLWNKQVPYRGSCRSLVYACAWQDHKDGVSNLFQTLRGAAYTYFSVISEAAGLSTLS